LEERDVDGEALIDGVVDGDFVAGKDGRKLSVEG